MWKTVDKIAEIIQKEWRVLLRNDFNHFIVIMLDYIWRSTPIAGI